MGPGVVNLSNEIGCAERLLLPAGWTELLDIGKHVANLTGIFFKFLLILDWIFTVMNAVHI
jgi:hypothetical protein